MNNSNSNIKPKVSILHSSMAIPETKYCVGNLTVMASHCCALGLQPVPAAQWALVLVQVSYTLCATIGTVVNLITLLALSMNKTIRNAPATTLVLHLAFADLLYCSIAVPSDAVSFMNNYSWDTSPLTKGLCSLSGRLKYVSGTVDWWCLALISVERYFKIVRGSESHERVFSKRNKRLLVLFWWSLTLVFMIAFADYGYNEWTKRCDWIPSQSKHHIIDRGKSHLIYMILVLVVIAFACLRIWYHVRQSGRSVERFTSGGSQTGEKSAQRWNPLSRLASCIGRHNPSKTTEDEEEGKSCDDQKIDTLQLPPMTSIDTIISCPTLTPKSSPRSPRKQSIQQETTKGAIQARELALVKILALTAGSYAILAVPMCLLNLLDYCVQYSNLRHAFYSVYVWTYVINFFIYVCAHPLYRKSCVLLLNRMNVFKNSSSKEVGSSEFHSRDIVVL